MGLHEVACGLVLACHESTLNN